jgi:hypothetical protein
VKKCYKCRSYETHRKTVVQSFDCSLIKPNPSASEVLPESHFVVMSKIVYSCKIHNSNSSDPKRCDVTNCNKPHFKAMDADHETWMLCEECYKKYCGDAPKFKIESSKIFTN